jgi:hypothetical protein
MKGARRWLMLGVTVGFLVALTMGVAAGSGKGPTVNPDAGRTDAERQAIYETMRANYEAHYAQWVGSIDLAKIDLSTLPHVAMNVQVVSGQPTLAAAISQADRVVIGTATSLQPTANGTLVIVQVSRTLKGPQTQSVVIHQASGLRPTPDWRGVFIADSPAEPLLLPGGRVELLLQNSPNGSANGSVSSALEIQSVSGMYYFTAGRARALELNPFAGEVDGLSEDQLAKAS